MTLTNHEIETTFVWFRCETCNKRGVKFWADNHARDKGHTSFTLEKEY